MSYTNTIPNVNPETNIAYGYIASSELDSDLVTELLFGSQATDESYYQAIADEFGLTVEQVMANDFDDETDAKIADFVETLQIDEPIVSGEYEGVEYSSSWLGGALNFFIFESPVITEKAEKASPCVQNAGILSRDMDGEVKSYSVPDDWFNRQTYE